MGRHGSLVNTSTSSRIPVIMTHARSPQQDMSRLSFFFFNGWISPFCRIMSYETNSSMLLIHVMIKLHILFVTCLVRYILKPGLVKSGLAL